MTDSNDLDSSNFGDQCNCENCSCNKDDEDLPTADSLEAIAIEMTIAWAQVIANPPTEEEFQNKLDYFIKLLTNKQIND